MIDKRPPADDPREVVVLSVLFLFFVLKLGSMQIIKDFWKDLKLEDYSYWF